MNYLWSPAKPEDAAGLAAAFNASAAADGLPERVGVEDMAHELESSMQPLDQRTTVVRADDEAIAGFATVYVREGHGPEHRAYIDTSVIPDARGDGLAAALTEWAIAAAERALASSPSPRRFVCSWLYNSLHDEANRLREHGFAPVRHWWEMERNLADPVVEAATVGFSVVPWLDDHSMKTRDVSDAAFADHWGSTPHTVEEWRSQLIESPSFRQDLSFVATRGESIIGYSYNQTWPEDWKAAGRKEAWIGSLGVLRDHRRRGVATALMLSSMRAMRKAGFDAAMIGVDSANPSGAQRLYESVGFRTKYEATTWQREVR